MPTSKYLLCNTPETTCPNGHQTVVMLFHENFDKKKPAFYICQTCMFVSELGVGPVTILCKGNENDSG